MKEKIIDWIKRNGIITVIGLLAIYFLIPGTAEINTVLSVIFYETLAISLSGIALYAYTKIDFTNKLLKGEDEKLNSVEQHGLYRVIGNVFVGVHLLVGLIVLGVYIANKG
jgi:hypothetical protein